MKDWKRFRRKEWKDFFIELTLASWGIGFYVDLVGHKKLFDIMIGCVTVGYEYKTRAYRRAIRLNRN